MVDRIGNDTSGLTEQIREIYQSEHLSEKEKDHLISKLIQQVSPQISQERFNPAGGYVISFLIPPLGFFVGVHYLLRYRRPAVRPAVICILLTCVSILIVFLALKVSLGVLSKILSELGLGELDDIRSAFKTLLPSFSLDKNKDLCYI